MNIGITPANKQQTPTFKGHKLVSVFSDPNYTKAKHYIYKLTNGQTVDIMNKKGSDIVTVNTVVKTGALNEPEDKRGISHALEHLTFIGSRKSPMSKALKPGEFDKRLEAMGASSNASTNTNRTSYFFNLAAKKWQKFADEAINLHATMIKYISLPKKAFEKEKEVIIQEIKMTSDNATDTQRNILQKLLFGQSRPNKNDVVIGTEKTVRNLSREDIFKYHQQNYTPDNLTTIIIGDVNPKKTIEIVDKYFDTPDFRQSSEPRFHTELKIPSETRVKFIPDIGEKDVSIDIGFLGPEASNEKENIASKILIYTLGLDKGSRFNKRLLALDSEAEVSLDYPGTGPSDNSNIFFRFKVVPGKEQRAIRTLGKTLKELKTTPITQEEFEIGKINVLDDFSQACETDEKLTAFLSSLLVRGKLEDYRKQIELINSVTLEDVNNATKYLDGKKAQVTILHPKNVSFKGGSGLISPKNIKNLVLPNNIKLVINNNPNTIRTAINVKVETDVPADTGVAEILVQMMDNSTAKLSINEFAQEKSKHALNNLGVTPTAQGLLFSSDSIPKSLPKAIELIKEMLLNPIIDKQSFLKARNEVHLSKDANEAKDRAIEMLYRNHPSGVSPRLLDMELNAVKLEHVQQYYKELMESPKVTVTITGPISQNKGLEKLIQSEFSSIKGKFVDEILPLDFEPLEENKVLVQIAKGRLQSDIVQMFHINTDNIKDVAAVHVLDNILGDGMTSRLFLDLREKQKLAYGVDSTLDNNEIYATEIFEIQTGIKDSQGKLTDNIEKAISGFERHRNNLMNTMPSETEVEKAKSKLQRTLLEDLSTSDVQNNCVLGGLKTKYGVNYYNKLMQEIEKIKPEDVREAARKYFSQPSVTSIITSKEAAKKSESFLKARGEYRFYEDNEMPT